MVVGSLSAWEKSQHKAALRALPHLIMPLKQSKPLFIASQLASLLVEEPSIHALHMLACIDIHQDANEILVTCFLIKALLNKHHQDIADQNDTFGFWYELEIDPGMAYALYS